MHGKSTKDSESIAKVCNRLKGFGQNISSVCGFHTHIGADYLQDLQAWKNFVELIVNNEEILYLIGNKEGEMPELERMKYIKPISGNIENILKSKKIESIKDIKEILKEAQGYNCKDLNLNEKRYYGINFLNVDESKNTIEYRISNGTLDYETIIENVELFGGIIRTAQNLSRIQNIDEKERTEKQKKALQIFEKLRINDIPEDERAKMFISLIVPFEKRNIYYKRYTTNRTLLNYNEILPKEVNENTAKHTIDLENNIPEIEL